MAESLTEFQPKYPGPEFFEHRPRRMTPFEQQQQRQHVIQIAAGLVVGKEDEVAFGD